MVDRRGHVMAVPAILLAGLAACTAAPAEKPEPGLTATIPTAPVPTPTVDPVTYPGEEWDREERGDWADLDRELQQTGSSCVAVVQDGQLVHDTYWNGGGPDVPVRTYSITKSLTSALVAMGVGDGVLALDDPASEQVDEWRVGAAGKVTTRDLLAMTSGREWSEATDRQLIRGSRDQTAYAIGLGQTAAPGVEWVYDNAAPQVLERVLAESMLPDDDVEQGDVVDLAQDRLLDPLGMDDTVWPRDGAGHATTYSGVTSTCQDMARLGHLMLQGGRWQDDQLIPADLVAESTRPSSELNAAYGLLWWTNAEGRVV